MDNEKVIYSLCVEDILTVIEENDMKIELDKHRGRVKPPEKTRLVGEKSQK